MKLFPKRKTDDEYVEFVRNDNKHSKRASVLLLFIAALQICVYFVYRTSQSEALDNFEELIKFDDGYYAGIVMGGVAGGFFVVAACHVVLAIMFFRGNRKDKLLIKYYDKLKECQKSDDDTSSE